MIRLDKLSQRIEILHFWINISHIRSDNDYLWRFFRNSSPIRLLNQRCPLVFRHGWLMVIMRKQQWLMIHVLSIIINRYELRYTFVRVTRSMLIHLVTHQLMVVGSVSVTYSLVDIHPYPFLG